MRSSKSEAFTSRSISAACVVKEGMKSERLHALEIVKEAMSSPTFCRYCELAVWAADLRQYPYAMECVSRALLGWSFEGEMVELPPYSSGRDEEGRPVPLLDEMGVVRELKIPVHVPCSNFVSVNKYIDSLWLEGEDRWVVGRLGFSTAKPNRARKFWTDVLLRLLQITSFFSDGVRMNRLKSDLKYRSGLSPAEHGKIWRSTKAWPVERVWYALATSTFERPYPEEEEFHVAWRAFVVQTRLAPLLSLRKGAGGFLAGVDGDGALMERVMDFLP